jgi:hypothetical protein
MPTGAPPALARVKWLAIELDPETLRMLRIGEGENYASKRRYSTSAVDASKRHPIPPVHPH